MDAVTSVVIGPAEHGVVRHAVQLAHAAGVRRAAAPRHVDDGAAGSARRRCTTGTSPTGCSAPCVEEATARLLGAMTARRRSPRRQPARRAGGDGRRARRPAGRGVPASRRDSPTRSSWPVTTSGPAWPERARADPSTSSPCPSSRPTRPPVAGPVARSVAVLGFVYPGKGHADVLEAAADLPADVDVVVIGRASDGHEDLLDDLRRIAGRQRRRFVVTGYLSDAAVDVQLRRAGVPVVPARDDVGLGVARHLDRRRAASPRGPQRLHRRARRSRSRPADALRAERPRGGPAPGPGRSGHDVARRTRPAGASVWTPWPAPTWRCTDGCSRRDRGDRARRSGLGAGQPVGSRRRPHRRRAARTGRRRRHPLRATGVAGPDVRRPRRPRPRPLRARGHRRRLA